MSQDLWGYGWRIAAEDHFTLYHHTTPEAAQAITHSGVFTPGERETGVWFTSQEPHAFRDLMKRRWNRDLGSAVIPMRIPVSEWERLEDEGKAFSGLGETGDNWSIYPEHVNPDWIQPVQHLTDHHTAARLAMQYDVAPGITVHHHHPEDRHGLAQEVLDQNGPYSLWYSLKFGQPNFIARDHNGTIQGVAEARTDMLFTHPDKYDPNELKIFNLNTSRKAPPGTGGALLQQVAQHAIKNNLSLAAHHVEDHARHYWAQMGAHIPDGETKGRWSPEALHALAAGDSIPAPTSTLVRRPDGLTEANPVDYTGRIERMPGTARVDAQQHYDDDDWDDDEPLGKLWPSVSSAQPNEHGSYVGWTPHTAARLAMPRQDAYGNNWPADKRQTEEPTYPDDQVWYHRSDHDLPDGTMLVPSGGKSRWDHVYHENDNRRKWVWLSTPDMEDFWGLGGTGKHHYQVQPEGEGPYPWNDDDSQYVAPRARIIRKINPKEGRFMSAAVTVYTKPSCPQCDMTKKVLQRMGIDHDTVDVTADPEAHAYVTGLGYQAAPVVVVNDGESHWSGFNPDKLKGLAE